MPVTDLAQSISLGRHKSMRPGDNPGGFQCPIKGTAVDGFELVIHQAACQMIHLCTPFVRQVDVIGARKAVFGGKKCRSVTYQVESGGHCEVLLGNNSMCRRCSRAASVL